MFEHNISPVIVSFGPFALRYYSLLFLCAFLLGLYLTKRVFELKGIDLKYLHPLFITIFICVVIGARLGHVFFYRPRYFLSHPLEIIKFWKGGLASHGAAIAMIIGVVIFTRIYPLTFYQVSDSVSIPIAVATSFVRLGNFFNSEIVGRVSTVPWAVKFLRYREPGGGPPQFRHPSQLYEVAIGIIIFITLWTLLKRRRDKLQDGALFYLLLIMYFTLRFLVEFVKEYPFIIPSIPLTTGQYLSIPFIIFSAYMLFVRGKIREQDGG
jgi:prolipoprotein diacylglyceryl transferase